jgi:hypothetical protein
MATFNWEVYADTPAWMGVATNTIVFSGSNTDLSEPITVGEWQSGSHLGSGDPGTDQCGATHMPNVKYVSDTQFDGGGGTETLNDTNLAETECTLRIKFTDASAVAISSARFYAFDGAVETNPAVGIEAYAFERGVGATEWTQICDYSASIGGDNAGERLDLGDKTAATEHYFYIAASARPETVGAKTEFDFGIALTYS